MKHVRLFISCAAMGLVWQAATSLRAQIVRLATAPPTVKVAPPEMSSVRSRPIVVRPDAPEFVASLARPTKPEPLADHEIDSADLPLLAPAADEPELLPPAPRRSETNLPHHARPDASRFPPLPPDPYAGEQTPLPSLDEELWLHGGAHLYEPEGDRRNWPDDDQLRVPYELLRLPETFQEPLPLTAFTDFLGADPIRTYPRLHWPGANGYAWEPQFVGYGSYQMFGFALEQNNRRQDVVGHQLLIDLDLRLTGTERFHVQYRPLGRRRTGGSYYQFSDPSGYVDNSTIEPDRYWFEGELHSMLGSFVDPFAALDYHVVAGRFPFALHNSLLMNDDIIGVVVNKNTIYAGPLSNLNVQVFYGANDVDAFTNADAQLYGVHATFDYRRAFFEATYAFVRHDFDASRDEHFTAFSGTQFFGPLSVAGRAMFKFGDEGGRGAGQLFVVESNYTRIFHENWAGVESAVCYGNAFVATSGWNSLAGGNFNRLRTSFEVNPLVQIAAGNTTGQNWGAAVGVQLFRHHDDESLIPEFAFQAPDNVPVWGVGLRYQRKTGPRSFFEALGVWNESSDSRFARQGVFVSETILF